MIGRMLGLTTSPVRLVESPRWTRISKLTIKSSPGSAVVGDDVPETRASPTRSWFRTPRTCAVGTAWLAISTTEKSQKMNANVVRQVLSLTLKCENDGKTFKFVILPKLTKLICGQKRANFGAKRAQFQQPATAGKNSQKFITLNIRNLTIGQWARDPSEVETNQTNYSECFDLPEKYLDYSSPWSIASMRRVPQFWQRTDRK